MTLDKIAKQLLLEQTCTTCDHNISDGGCKVIQFLESFNAVKENPVEAAANAVVQRVSYGLCVSWKEKNTFQSGGIVPPIQQFEHLIKGEI